MRDRWALGMAALVAGGLLAGLVGPAKAACTRLGYVDIQKVLVRSVAGVAAREQLERERVSMQKDLESRKAEIDKLRDEI